MANQYVNKFIKDGVTKFDLTSDTVTPETLAEGVTAHDASGAQVTGTFKPVTGVKGNAETNYRTGNVNLTPAHIGAATTAQGTKADSAVQTVKMNGSAVTKTDGVVDLGTVITAHQNISGKADKSATVSTVAYDTTNKKLTKTIDGTTSDIVTTSKLKTDMALSKSDVGLGNVGNFKAVSTVASQGLTDTEKANARTNIGAGTSSFSGSYNDLSNKPTIPAAVAVKGNAESTYRTGNVNLTPANIGAATTAQGTKADSAVQTIQIGGTAQTKTDGVVNLPAYPTKSSLGMSNVENKSSATIRGELTSSNVTTALGYTPLNSSLKGSNNGLAELDSNGKVPSSQLPSFVDDVLEYDNKSKFPTTGETGKIYLDKTTNLAWRWSGTTYAEISPSIAIGETSSTAYRGDRGKIAYDHSQSTHARTDATKVESSSTNGNIKINGTETAVYTHPGSGTNPHGTTKSDIGLSNVGNFKAVSTVASQGLTDTEKSNARANIGAGTSSFSGSYNDLSNKPTIPTKVSQLTNDSGYTTNTGTVTQVKIGSTAYNPSSGVISLPAYPTDTNTHRPIQLNGTEILGNNTTVLNLKSGSNISMSNSSGTVTISATDTNTTYSAGTGTTITGTNNAINVAYGTTANTACQGNDSRLSNARPASDVYSWAKAASKPTYTASEVGAAPASHTQASNTINAMTGYSKPSSTSAITTSDTLNAAIGKLEKGLESAGGGSPFIKVYDTAYYDRLRITFKKSTFSCALFLQTIESSSAGNNGMSYVCGDQSIIRTIEIVEASSASSIVSTGTGSISGKAVTLTARYIQTIYIPADVFSQISKVEVNAKGSGPVPSDIWETIYEA